MISVDIALYHPWLKSKGGAERLVFEYASRSRHDVTVFTHHHEDSFDDYDIRIEQLTDRPMPDGFMRKGMMLARTQLATKIDLEPYDAFLVSEAGLGSLITLRNHDIPTMVYTHTPLRAVHQFYEYYKKQYGALQRQGFRAAATVYRQLEKQAWKNFDRVACNSENTRNTLKDAGLIDEKPCRVIYPGIDPEAFTHEAPEDFFLYPGRFKSYKRQELAIEAFKEFSDTHEGYRLVLAGFPDDEAYLADLRDQYGDDPMIEFRTDLSDSELTALYGRAKAVMFTAKNEDWGIVPLEAMAAGKPVIAVDEGGPAESMIDGETGFLVDARPEAIADKMNTLVDDDGLYARQAEAAAKRARRFTWDRFSDELDEEVEQLV